MQIALFCHKFWPAVGGLCTYTGRLAEFLAGRGHHVSVYTAYTEPSSPHRERFAPGVDVIRFDLALASHPPYYFMPGLLREAPAIRADVVHSVGYYFFGTTLAHLLARRRGIPHVCTPVYTLNPSNWQRRSFDLLAGRRIVRGVDHLLPQSAHELELLAADRFDVNAHSVVPFGVDSPLFEADYDTSDLRTLHAIEGNERVLLFVGKVMSPKGAFDALAAAARLRDAGRRIRLIMIGDVHDRERRQFADRIDELRLQRAVVLPGPVTDRRELSRYYQLADVVVFPSQYEQFGIVALEAAASGRPLLGTPVGIMQTLVPALGFGLLHPFGDVDQFAANAAEVLDNPRYRENAARNRKDVLARYDWRAISAETERIYMRLKDAAG